MLRISHATADHDGPCAVVVKLATAQLAEKGADGVKKEHEGIVVRAFTPINADAARATLLRIHGRTEGRRCIDCALFVNDYAFVCKRSGGGTQTIHRRVCDLTMAGRWIKVDGLPPEWNEDFIACGRFEEKEKTT